MRCDDILFPALAAWEINTECNHKCKYCYNYRCVSAKQREYSEDKMNQVSDFIISRKPIGVFISGGEPLLLYPLLKKQIEKFESAGVFVSIYTNGALINEDIARFLGEMRVRVMVSFPSVYENEFAETVTSGTTYNKVVEGLRLLKKYSVRVEPNIVVTKINYNSVEETVEYLQKEFSPRKIFISRATRPSNADTEFDRIALSRQELNAVFDRCTELSRKYAIEMGTCGGFAPCVFDDPETRAVFGKTCAFGINGYAVNTDGDVKICVRESRSYGNIFTDRFEDIRANMCQWLDMPVPVECSGCEYVDGCRGGCKFAVKSGESELAYMDCDACVEAGKRVHFAKRKHTKHRITDSFIVKDIAFVEDQHSTRASVGFNYFYMNNGLAKLLKRKSEFTVLGLCVRLRLGYKHACRIIDKLLANKMVEKNG